MTELCTVTVWNARLLPGEAEPGIWTWLCFCMAVFHSTLLVGMPM